jgi:hypothetical protein
MDEIRDPQYKSADGSALRIWRDTAKNNFLTEREGRPIFDEVIYVEVISPGSRDSTPTFEVVRNFAKESQYADKPHHGPKYDEFKSFILDFEKAEDSDSTLAGTPFSQWPEMTRAMAAALKAQSIFTVDALAALPDTKLNAVGPDGRTWREKAKAYVEAAKNGAHATALAADLERANLELADNREQMKLMAAKVAALEAAQAGGTVQAPKAPKAAKTASEPAPEPAATDPLAEPIPPGLVPAPASII